MIGVLIAIIVGAGLICILMAVSRIQKKGSGARRTGKSKNNAVMVRECTKKLAKDPHNVEALKTLADIYYSESNYEKSFSLYQTLFKLMGVHVELDQVVISQRYGVCAFKMEKFDEAMTAFSKVLHLNPKDYTANFYIGKIMIEKEDFEKAVLCLKRAAVINPERSEICEPLSIALFKTKKFRESLTYLKKVLDENPENKQALFYIANAMEETGMSSNALKIFMHLRTDAKFGPESCAGAAAIHEKQGQYDKAVQDYEIALKLETIPMELKTRVCYKLAQAHIALHSISKALSYLKQIQTMSPNYKDVNALVARYQELNQNNNLQVYLMSGTSDFVVLCRKIVTGMYSNSFVKIEDMNTATDNIEILCTVESSKWSDTELFRFFRSTSSIGELYVRDFHSKMRDIKCDRGFCITAGSFSPEAKKYVEGRPIDLIEKSKLVQILKKINV